MVFPLTYFTNFKEYSEVLNFERERHFSLFYEELLYNKCTYKCKMYCMSWFCIFTQFHI